MSQISVTQTFPEKSGQVVQESNFFCNSNILLSKPHKKNNVGNNFSLCFIKITGWHLPSDAEWTTLSTYLSGESVAGGKMKSTLGWKYDADGNASNSSGFSA